MPTLDQFRSLLEARRADLSQRVDRLKQDISKTYESDWSEQAQQRENDEVLNALGHEAEQELHQVNLALDRIRRDAYGICQRCDGEIGEDRLLAQPAAAYCIRCAS